MLRSAFAVFACFTSTVYACDMPEPDHGLQAVYESLWSRSGHVRRAKLERAQEAWLEYRQASCEIISARADGLSADAQAQCLSFMARERTAELELIGRFAPEEQEAEEEDGC